MIRGTTALVAHIGWPTHAFKAPMIYNPCFERAGVDAVVVPMGCREEHYPAFCRAVFTLENIRGALDHDAAQGEHGGLAGRRSPAVQIAGACNAVRRDADGRLRRRPVRRRRVRARPPRKGCAVDGARALVVGAGGVGSAIAASLARGRRGIDRRSSTRAPTRRRRSRRGSARTTRRFVVQTGLQRSGRASTSSSTRRRSA